MKVSAFSLFLTASAILPTSIFGALRHTEITPRGQDERELKSSSSDPREKKLENRELDLCIGFYFDRVKIGDAAIWVDCDDAPKFRFTGDLELEVIPIKSLDSSDDPLCLTRINDILIELQECDDLASQNMYPFAVYDEKNIWRIYNRAGANWLSNFILVDILEIAVETVIESSVEVDFTLDMDRRLEEFDRRLEGTHFNVANRTEELFENEERIKVYDVKRNKTLQVNEWRVDPNKFSTSRRLQRMHDDEYIVEFAEVFVEIILLPVFVEAVGFVPNDDENKNQHWKGLECEFVFG